jgi:hypothetical protein
MTQRFAELLEMVRLARGAGFHHVSASQHYLAAPFRHMPSAQRACGQARTGHRSVPSRIIPARWREGAAEAREVKT